MAINPDTGEILASALTTTDDGDTSQVGPLLDQIPGLIASLRAEGAYASAPVYRAVAEREPNAAVILPPRSTAVPSRAAGAAPTRRDRHIQVIAAKGRMGWQQAVGYGRRALVDTALFRDKGLIGRRLRARTLCAQKVEVRIACAVINRMTKLGMPSSRRVA